MAMNNRLLRPRASGFSPQQIAGLAVWLDAADASTVTLNSGNVSEWRDLSGNARHFAQSTSGAQPTYTTAGQNGKNCLTFDGSRRLVSSVASTEWSFLHDGIQPYTLYCVWKADGGAMRTILSTGNSAQGIRAFYVWHDFGLLASNNVRAEVTTSAAGNFVIIRNMGSQTSGVTRWFRIDGDLNNGTAANRMLLTNNAAASSTAETAGGGLPATGAPAQNLAIGSLSDTGQSFGFSGVICEVIAYSRSSALSATEQSAVQTYLNRKWGL